MICALIRARQNKSFVICFCTYRTYIEYLPYVDINGTDIESVIQAKVLGVTISSDLSWSAYVDEILTKTRKRVNMIILLKRVRINDNYLFRIFK